MPTDRSGSPLASQALEFDGKPVNIRLELQGVGWPVPACIPVGSFPVRRIAIVRDDAGIAIQMLIDEDKALPFGAFPTLS